MARRTTTATAREVEAPQAGGRKATAEGEARPKAPRAPRKPRGAPKVELVGLRAPGHRGFIGSEFGALADIGGPNDDPAGLSYFEIMADPRLAELGRRVFDDLRRQFASDQRGETDEEEAYRRRLENWADALEVMLEEVLNELSALGSPRTEPAGGPALF